MKAMRLAVDNYNATPNDLLDGLAPLQVGRDNVGRILNFQLKQKQNKTEKYPASIDDKFKIGDFVRVVLPKTRFTKANEPKWSAEIYEIIDIEHSSWPTPSYKLKAVDTGVIPPGTFTFDQIKLSPQ
jgi:hypothetical protein